MSMTDARIAIPLTLLGCLVALPAAADTTFFSTGDTDGKIATATRPESAGKFEIESADDFILTQSTSITGATFTGLITGPSPLISVGEVRVEIYRVFPKDSDVGRTSGPPTFSTSQVPTRVNSPSDVALDTRDSTSGLTLTMTDLGAFSALTPCNPAASIPHRDRPPAATGRSRARKWSSASPSPPRSRFRRIIISSFHRSR